MSNIITEKLTSLQIEKQLLGGLFNHRHKDCFYVIDSFVKETDFANKTHEILYSIFRQHMLGNKEIDKVVWAQKFKELNIGTRDEIKNIFEYIDAICYTSLNEKGVINNAKELVKLRVRRDIYKDALEVQDFILGSKCSNKTLTEIIGEVDSIYNKRINSISTDDEPVDLFAGIEAHIKEIASNPIKEVGLITPFNQFNKFFGGLKSGDGAYLWAARLSEGKSVWMFNLAKGISILNNCKVLYLDTEMSLKLNMNRAGAAEAGINPWYLQNGRWVENPDLIKKVNDSFLEFKKYNGLFFHKYVPNRNIKELLSIARKWKLKHVGRNENAFIILDYLKITGSDSNSDRSEWQDFGDRVCYLNEFGADFNATIGIAAQQNRTANQNGIRLDDDTTIGGSDRIGQYSRWAGILRRKTLEEIAEQGTQFGTHLLKPVKYSRDQGEADYANNCYIKILDTLGRTKYVQDYINLKIHHYDIKEAGTLRDIIEHQSRTKPLEDDKQKEEDKSVDI